MNVLRAWCVNGLFQQLERKVILKIPLPIKMRPVSMRVENDELVVEFRDSPALFCIASHSPILPDADRLSH